MGLLQLKDKIKQRFCLHLNFTHSPCRFNPSGLASNEKAHAVEVGAPDTFYYNQRQ